MPLSLSDDTAQLVGVVSVDEAEPLAQWLRSTPAPKVGLKRCSTLHTAALQALLAAAPEVVSPPRDPFLLTWVLPLLEGPEAEDSGVDDADAEDAVPAEPEAADDVSAEPEDEGLDPDLVLPPGLAALGEPADPDTD